MAICVILCSVEDLLTTKQLMEMLQLDRTTIYRMLNDGRLPGVRVGGQWRFSRRAIDAWLKEQYLPGAAANKAAPEIDAEQRPIGLEALPLYCLSPIQEVFAATSETGAVTTDLNGNLLTPFSNTCRFCSLILESEQGRARCQASWKRLAGQKEKHPRLEKCHAGLTYARGRIVVQETFIAMFFVGQFVVDSAEELNAPSHISEIAHTCQVDEATLGQAARELRVLERGRAERLLGLLQMVADTFSHIGQERFELMSRLKQVAEIARLSAA